MAFAFTILFTQCTAPRSFQNSGKVTPLKQFKVGGNMQGNIPTNTVDKVFNGIENSIKTYQNVDTIRTSPSFLAINEAIVAYSIDPISFGYDFYLRYGLLKRFDIGYRYSGGTHVFDAAFQFMGDPTSPDLQSTSKFFGSIGLQYSSASFKLEPSLSTLGSIATFLSVNMNRKDLIIPLTFSFSFGEEEKYGCFTFGLVYGRTYWENKIETNPNIYIQRSGVANVLDRFTSLSAEDAFNSFGGFINLKLGYKYVYILPAISFMGQNYGTFPLLDGSKVEFSGLTIVPSIGIHATIPYFFKKKKKE